MLHVICIIAKNFLLRRKQFYQELSGIISIGRIAQ